jgi:hypothetical protein
MRRSHRDPAGQDFYRLMHQLTNRGPTRGGGLVRGRHVRQLSAGMCRVQFGEIASGAGRPDKIYQRRF